MQISLKSKFIFLVVFKQILGFLMHALLFTITMTILGLKIIPVHSFYILLFQRLPIQHRIFQCCDIAGIFSAV